MFLAFERINALHGEGCRGKGHVHQPRLGILGVRKARVQGIRFAREALGVVEVGVQGILIYVVEVVVVDALVVVGLQVDGTAEFAGWIRFAASRLASTKSIRAASW